jgi:hypothetical protein
MNVTNKLILDERLYYLCRVWYDWWASMDYDNVRRHAYNSTVDGDMQKCVLPHFRRLTCATAARYVGEVAR